MDGIDDGYVDLSTLLGAPTWAAGFAAVDIEVPDERAVQLRLRSDSHCKLWLNGELVWQAYRLKESVRIDGDSIPVTLQPGRNRLLVKVATIAGDLGFYLRVTDEEGEGYRDLHFTPPEPAQ